MSVGRERESLTGCRGRAAAAAGRVGWTRAQRFPRSRSCNSCKKERNTRKCFLVKYIQRWKKKTQSATVTFNEQTVVFIDNYIYIYIRIHTRYVPLYWVLQITEPYQCPLVLTCLTFRVYFGFRCVAMLTVEQWRPLIFNLTLFFQS